MSKWICLFIVMMTTSVQAICVHEKHVTGGELEALTTSKQKVFVLDGDQFVKASELKSIDKSASYLIQLGSQAPSGYDDTYIKYYHYSRIQQYIESKRSILELKGYQIEIVGKSIEGRDLYSIHPKVIDPTKKLVLMYGRHHGDEGTANWIIEGFMNSILKSDWLENFQLVIYPMINPDGAENKRRYNARGRDLNRVWNTTPSRSKDEVRIIQGHLKKLVFDRGIKPVTALDMHGSFTEDFIYRVNKKFRSLDFYNQQQELISDLGSRDPYQKGNFQLSDGDPKMGRIYLVREFGVNALTHETPRDIRKNSGRTLTHLFEQGIALAQSISALY